MPRKASASVVLDPIGFVCDHVEVLYDIDMLFRNYAAERGIDTASARRAERLARSLPSALAEVR